jgi:hypothetical protein
MRQVDVEDAPLPGDRAHKRACPGYVKDHVLPLACGGPDAVSNLQWQTIRDAKAKDKWETKAALVGVSLPPLARYHHIDLSAAVFGADQLLAVIEHWRFGAIPSSHLGGVELNQMTAFSAPYRPNQEEPIMAFTDESTAATGRGFTCRAPRTPERGLS